VIPTFDHMEGRAGIELFGYVGDEIEPGKGVAGPLKEQHRYVHPLEVIGPAGTGLAGRVERES
jgi:hypothetical protein